MLSNELRITTPPVLQSINFMKTSSHTLYFAIVMLAMTCIFQPSFAAVQTNPEAVKIEQASDFTTTQISTLNKAQLEQRLGRKLTIKEKLGVAIVKRQLKKNKPNKINAPTRTDGFAIAGFVCSLVSLFILGIPLGILGVIFSAVGMGRVNNSEGKLKGRGMAIAGLVIGIVGLAVVLIFLSSGGFA